MKNKLYFLTNYSVNCCFIDDLEITEKQAKEIIKTSRQEIARELEESEEDYKEDIYKETTEAHEGENARKTEIRFYEGCNCVIIEKYEALNNTCFNDELEHKQIKRIVDSRIFAQQVATYNKEHNKQ